MRLEKDYEDLLKLFNRHKVKYCIVGAYAVAFYGMPRYTKDIDILIEPDVKNAINIIKALNEFGFASPSLTVEAFSKGNKIIQLGYEPVRIDILTSLPGVKFKEVWGNKKRANYGKQRVSFIGRKELMKIKRVSNRKQDQADLEILKRLK